MAQEQNKQQINIGDIIKFHEAAFPAISHWRTVIGFDRERILVEETDGKVTSVSPSQVEEVAE